MSRRGTCDDEVPPVAIVSDSLGSFSNGTTVPATSVPSSGDADDDDFNDTYEGEDERSYRYPR